MSARIEFVLCELNEERDFDEAATGEHIAHAIYADVQAGAGRRNAK